MERFLEKMDRDRRLSRRQSLRAPLRIRVRKSDVAERCAESENLFQRGVYFATDLPLNKGASLDLLLEMPEEISGVPPAHWLCTGHVVRVVPPASSGEKHGRRAVRLLRSVTVGAPAMGHGHQLARPAFSLGGTLMLLNADAGTLSVPITALRAAANSTTADHARGTLCTSVP